MFSPGRDERMPEQADVTQKTERTGDALRQEQLKDPRVRARIKQIFEEAKKDDRTPVVTAEDLPRFLREHGK